MSTAETNPGRWVRWSRVTKNSLAFTVAMMGVLAALAPLSRGECRGRVGVLLIVAALIEFAHGFRRSTSAAQRSAHAHGVITFLMGLLLINAPLLASQALVLFFAGWFAVDGVRQLLACLGRAPNGRLSHLFWAIGNLTVAVLLAVFRETGGAWSVAIASAIRLLDTAAAIQNAPVFSSTDSGATVADDLGLADEPEIQEIARAMAIEEVERSRIDIGWIVAFVVTLLAVHLGRMGYDRTLVGLLGPTFAVLGDMILGLLITFGLVIPFIATSNRITRMFERRAWRWCLSAPAGERGLGRRAVQSCLATRMRVAVRLRQARYSFSSALSRGLQIGLPIAAVIAATTPIWGMSWYFDTENWAAGIWNSWAEHRTDDWREAMVAAVTGDEEGKGPAERFAVAPPGIDPRADYSFLVLGDPGEGDASQLSLKAHWLSTVRRDDVKFVVISSDVIYPTGAMRNYENNFWLPMMGTAKPVYAIPGNHDWYDALEGFAATFFTPEAARKTMRARIELDRRISGTTDSTIDALVARASRYREWYGVPTQLQRAPYFQWQTENFALFCLDTGVARRLDPKQLAWLEAGLESARGKMIMALLGHPVYAAGRDTSKGDEEFTALVELLRKHDVRIVMAGDTHDLEYYPEPRGNGRPTMHHVVNGGGGAYLSFGTALDWPANPVTADWAHYPSYAQVVAKINATTPWWKRPAWWWTKKFGAWPFSAEWLSAAFDANVAPFYQSFIEVRVEPARRRIRLIAHGPHGPLRWRDIQQSRPASDPDGPVEWVVE